MLVSSRCLIFPYPCHHRFLGCILCLSSSRAFLPMLSFWHKQGSPNLHTGRSNTGHVQVLHICIRPLPGLCKDCQEQHEGTLDINNHSYSNLDKIIKTTHTVPHVTLLVNSGKFTSGLDFFLSPPENKKAKFAFCTLKRKGGSTQKQPFLTVRFRGALLTKSVTLEFSQDRVWICKG